MRWMQHALTLAERAQAQGEVPVGAVIVDEADNLVAEGWNQPIGAHDATAHAEIMAIRAACSHNGNYRLSGLTLYVTLEPCLMCAGAMIHARIRHLVYGAADPRAGAVESVFRAFDEPRLNHRVTHEGGLMAESCGDVLRQFFRARR